jgi:hypothetical protein
MISPSDLLKMRNVSENNCRENIQAFYIQRFFLSSTFKRQCGKM